MENIEKKYECIMSIGMRCFTEIFLKELGLKKFSGPFDAMFNSSVSSIIDILKNKIQEEDLIYTENIKNKDVNLLNSKHGFRTIHKNINYFDNDLVSSYHSAFLPHHNLNDSKTKQHFERCFERLNKIKLHNIVTLFCLFIHPNYGDDKDIPFNQIQILEKYLIENFNCRLLVCKFEQKNNYNFKWKTVIDNKNLMYIHINNNSHIYKENEIILKEIFSSLSVNEENLLTYEKINNLG